MHGEVAHGAIRAASGPPAPAPTRRRRRGRRGARACAGSAAAAATPASAPSTTAGSSSRADRELVAGEVAGDRQPDQADRGADEEVHRHRGADLARRAVLVEQRERRAADRRRRAGDAADEPGRAERAAVDRDLDARARSRSTASSTIAPMSTPSWSAVNVRDHPHAQPAVPMTRGGQRPVEAEPVDVAALLREGDDRQHEGERDQHARHQLRREQGDDRRGDQADAEADHRLHGRAEQHGERRRARTRPGRGHRSSRAAPGTRGSRGTPARRSSRDAVRSSDARPASGSTKTIRRPSPTTMSASVRSRAGVPDLGGVERAVGLVQHLEPRGTAAACPGARTMPVSSASSR